MKRTLLSLSGIAAVATMSVCFASSASALTINFDSAPNGYTAGTSYSESGYTFTLSGGSIPHFGDGALPTNGTLNWHDGGDNASGVLVRLTNNLGLPFNFMGFDLLGFSGTPFRLTSSLGQTADFSTMGSKTLNWLGVSWIDFDVANNVSIDNVVVDNALAVPTPALLPGLIGVGVAALRKKRKDEIAEEAVETAEANV